MGRADHINPLPASRHLVRPQTRARTQLRYSQNPAVAASLRATKQKTLDIAVEGLACNGGADGTRTRDLRRDRPAF
jgi:hypothetical protein